MDGTLLNIVTLLAYTALALDFVLQIHRVWIQRHSKDISLVGVVVRTTAAAIILVKVAIVGDTYLVVGQLAMVALLFIYLGVVFHFRNSV